MNTWTLCERELPLSSTTAFKRCKLSWTQFVYSYSKPDFQCNLQAALTLTFIKQANPLSKTDIRRYSRSKANGICHIRTGFTMVMWYEQITIWPCPFSLSSEWFFCGSNCWEPVNPTPYFLWIFLWFHGALTLLCCGSPACQENNISSGLHSIYQYIGVAV